MALCQSAISIGALHPLLRTLPRLQHLAGVARYQPCPSARPLAPPPGAGARTTRCGGAAACAIRLHAMAAPAALHPRAAAVLDYWFGEGWAAADPGDQRKQRMRIWYQGGAEIDAEIIEKFGADCEALLAGEYDAWQQGPPAEALAGIIIGDQLFRNAYRGTAKMYAADPSVLAWAKALIGGEGYSQLKPIQRVFALMPLMHSEALADQEACVAGFERLQHECAAGGWGDMIAMSAENIKYAQAHRDVVARWGRFPHRNAILGRPSTPEEAEGIAAGTIPKW